MDSTKEDENFIIESYETWLKIKLPEEQADHPHNEKPTSYWWRNIQNPTTDDLSSEEQILQTNLLDAVLDCYFLKDLQAIDDVSTDLETIENDALKDFNIKNNNSKDLLIENNSSKDSEVENNVSLDSVKTKQSKKRKCIQEKEPKVIIKRPRQPELWKVNVLKNARLKGEEYVGVGGKVVPAKIMGPPCNCRLNCYKNVNEEIRKELHNIFWQNYTWEQRKQFVAISVTEAPKKRSRCRGKMKTDRRQVTLTYALLIDSEFITVCKGMFLSTFSISEKFVRLAMEKKRISPGGILSTDQCPKTKKSETVKDIVRKHIKSFPTEKPSNSNDDCEKRYLDAKLNIAVMHKLYVKDCREKGLPESDIVRENYYRDIFKTEFNLGFKNLLASEKEKLN